MVIYDLNCAAGHQFEGWFNRPGDYEQQAKSSLLTCPICGSTHIRKLPTASHVSTRSKELRADAAVPSHQQTKSMMAWEQIRAYVDKHFRDVGSNFPEEARKIHYGEVDADNIQGTATPAEVEALHEEGVEAFSLPRRLTAKNKLN